MQPAPKADTYRMEFRACALVVCSALTFAGCTSAQQRTMPASIPQSAGAPRGRSWMLPQARRQDLLYVTSPAINDVDVYTLDGTQVGHLTGFSEPTGMCVDRYGYVYVANTGSGTLVKYAHGGTSAVSTYEPGAPLSGCSVDATGDVAATIYQPGAVVVYAGGDPNDGTTYQNSSCPLQETMGYDDRGNLIGVTSSTQSKVTLCALMSGAASETVLTLNGVQMHDPGSSMWDGKYMTLTDQMVDGEFETGIIRVSLAGSSLVPHGERLFTSPCSYASMPHPFIVGKKNTPVNHQEGTLLVGNSGCGSSYSLGFWHYPKGGSYFKYYDVADRPYGEAVSIAR